MRPFAQIDDFFEPGQTLQDELDDRNLVRDLEHNRLVLLNIRAIRYDRAYTDAEPEARALGLPAPTEDMIDGYVRFYEQYEKDMPPTTY